MTLSKSKSSGMLIRDGRTRKVSVLTHIFVSYIFVLLGLGILALGLHDSLQGMTARECDRGVVAACKSIGR